MIAKYQLTIDVVYCADDQQGLDACRRKLDGLAERASSEGLFSSDHHDCFVVEVDSFLKPADLTREELEELYGDAAEEMKTPHETLSDEIT